MAVPMLDLRAQFGPLRDEIIAEVTDVLASQMCVGGPKVAALEEKLAAACGCRYGVGVSSGTDAILNCLMSLEIGAGDAVITTPFTFFATVGSIVRVGARPLFVDIDEKTYNLDPAGLEAAMTEGAKAIMPVHLYGQMADMDPIMQVAENYGLSVIEDCAQAIGSTYRGRPAGSMSTAGCLSFYPTKNLNAAGDGGMIVSNDEAFSHRARIMRNHGMEPKYYHKYVGGNFRLDAIQAAVLLCKLPRLEVWNEKRRQNAAFYDGAFAGSDIVTPYISEHCVSTYHQYCIRAPRRDELVAYLRDKQIGCDIYYPVPLHLQECFADLGYKEGDFPIAEAAAKDILALPIYPELTEAMLEEVADSILSYYK